MAFLNNITQVRNVEWATSYLWDVRFLGAPSPFHNWFPATAVEQELLTVNAHSFEAGLTTFDFPRASASKSITLTFLDDESHSLQSWMRGWVDNTIFMGGQYVNYLSASVKELHIVKLDRRRNPLFDQPEVFYVFPEGGMSYAGSSESGALEFSVSFRVAGRGSTSGQSSNSGSGQQLSALSADSLSGFAG